MTAAVATPPRRKLTFEDTQLLLAAVAPGRALQADHEVLKYIETMEGQTCKGLAQAIENSPRDEVKGFIKVIALARQVYGKLSAYKDLQGAVL